MRDAICSARHTTQHKCTHGYIFTETPAHCSHAASRRLYDEDTVSNDFLGTAVIQLAKTREQHKDEVQVRAADSPCEMLPAHCVPSWLLPCTLVM